MGFKISGFCGTHGEAKGEMDAVERIRKARAPRKSLVQVQFPGKGMALAYYNDQFDLQEGDRVYVDGKMEGLLGRVVEINYNFKIKRSEYKKVLAVVDTDISGQFQIFGSHFVTFDPSVMPVEQVKLWFNPPEKEDEEFVVGSDDSSFMLEDLSGMNVSPAIGERGQNYYMENRVVYLCLDGNRGFAIVEGTENYTVEFQYENGAISQLVCDCPCAYTCKHEVAVMLQLRETLTLLEEAGFQAWEDSRYMAAITKGSFFYFVINGKETGTFTI